MRFVDGSAPTERGKAAWAQPALDTWPRAAAARGKPLGCIFTDSPAAAHRLVVWSGQWQWDDFQHARPTYMGCSNLEGTTAMKVTQIWEHASTTTPEPVSNLQVDSLARIPAPTHLGLSSRTLHQQCRGQVQQLAPPGSNQSSLLPSGLSWSPLPYSFPGLTVPSGPQSFRSLQEHCAPAALAKPAVLNCKIRSQTKGRKLPLFGPVRGQTS